MLSCAERAPIDLFLSRLLLAEIDLALIEGLRCPDVMSVLGVVEPEVRSEIEAPWTAGREERARVEFARLFLLPGGVSPRASAWIFGEGEHLVRPIAALISSALEILDPDVVRKSAWRNPPRDHLGLLLALVATAGNSENAEVRRVGERLRAGALGSWVARFGRSLRLNTCLPIYRAAGVLLETLHGSVDPLPDDSSLSLDRGPGTIDSRGQKGT